MRVGGEDEIEKLDAAKSVSSLLSLSLSLCLILLTLPLLHFSLSFFGTFLSSGRSSYSLSLSLSLSISLLSIFLLCSLALLFSRRPARETPAPRRAKSAAKTAEGTSRGREYGFSLPLSPSLFLAACVLSPPPSSTWFVSLSLSLPCFVSLLRVLAHLSVIDSLLLFPYLSLPSPLLPSHVSASAGSDTNTDGEKSAPETEPVENKGHPLSLFSFSSGVFSLSLPRSLLQRYSAILIASLSSRCFRSLVGLRLLSLCLSVSLHLSLSSLSSVSRSYSLSLSLSSVAIYLPPCQASQAQPRVSRR